MDGRKKKMTSVVKCPMCSATHLALSGNLKPGDYSCTCENCGHFFKFRSVGDLKADITVTINGERYTIGNEYHQATSLLEFMRRNDISRGTKGCCYEGGCGVCLVTVKFLDPLTGSQRSYPVNSCCLQLYTCDGLEVTTIEGIGNTRQGLHPVQDRMAKMDGIQCGYCSPGQIMNIYGFLQNNPRPTMRQVEDHMDSTLCRCTGYRAILDAMKSFATDAPSPLKAKGGVIDIEELESKLKLCKKSGEICKGQCKSKGEDCGKSIPRPVHIVTELGQWLKPLTLAELYALLKQHAGDRYRLVFGNTGFGAYGDVGPWNYDVLIDIRGVADLYTVDLSPSDHITFGGNVSLTALKEAFENTTDPGLPYAKPFAEYLGFVGSSSVRNLGSWAGNLMLKHLHNDFASDVFTMLETVNAQITVANSDGVQTQYSLPDFLRQNMVGKVIVSVRLPKYTSSSVVIRAGKTSHRLQLSVAYVCSGFNFDVDAANDYLVRSKPNIVIQGINGTLIHAVQTEGYLTNKKLGDPTVLSAALTTLSGELVPSTTDPLQASGTYRKSLAISQFYKFVLSVCKSKCTNRYVSGGVGIDRPVMTASHDLGTSDPSVYPATKPMMQLYSENLSAGEVKFTGDLPTVPGTLFAAPVLSDKGNCKISSVDATGALQIPGVVRFIQAADIPGINNWRPRGYYDKSPPQELLCSGQVYNPGQPIGILVAEDLVTAQSARAGVKVNYTDVRPCITDIDDAVQQRSFYAPVGPFTKGNATAAMATAPNKVSGSIKTPSQYNFYLENQAALCTPTGTGGMDVKCTSQWILTVLQSVSQVLGLNESQVNAEAPRLGGGFGGKWMYPCVVASMSAVSAHVTQRPVLLNLDIHTNMQFPGKRSAFRFDYEIGFDNNGKMLAMIVTSYADVGAYDIDPDPRVQFWFDSVYNCDNVILNSQPCRTDNIPWTACRSPTGAPSVFAMECMIDHVATYLGKDHLEVRKVNLYQNGQTTIGGVLLEHCVISSVVNEHQAQISYAQRLQAVQDFNRDNRWKKRGLHVMPSRYGMEWDRIHFTVTVSIHGGDGSVMISHAGSDMGQGINTKIVQCCAYKLGVPMDIIEVKATSTTTSPNSIYTAGSTSTEVICMNVMKCCDELLTKMVPSKAKLINPTWKEIVRQCYADLVDMRAISMIKIEDKYPAAHYSTWSSIAVEVEVDVLTGQYQLRLVDFLNDCGTSLNPELDIGQVEGGFLLGLGLFTMEDLRLEPGTGRVQADGTWHYKIPLTKDLPLVFNVKLLRNRPNPAGVLGSKTVGEAPVQCGAAAFLALKRAVEAARQEVGQQGYFPFKAPCTVDFLQQACLNNISQYTFGN